MTIEYDGIENNDMSIMFDYIAALDELDRIFGGIYEVLYISSARRKMLKDIDKITYTCSTDS